MLKRLFSPLLFLFLTALFVPLACNALSLPLWDLSTDAGVIQAYNTITEQQLGADDICIHRPDGLNDVVVIGLFASDVGCRGDELFVGQTLGHFDNLTDEGLDANGWNDRTGREPREVFALRWVEEVLLAWREPVQAENDDFQKADMTFSPPVAQTLSDGRIQVDVWVREPSGMLPETNYTLLRVIFEADGNLGEQTDLDSFTVSFGE